MPVGYSYVFFGKMAIQILCSFFNRVFKKIYLFNVFLAALGLVAVCGLSLVVGSGGYSSLWRVGSRHVGFSNCGTRAQ